MQQSNSSANGQDDARASGLDAFTLNPKQQLVLHEDNWANEILFGGAKYGGKSFLMRYVMALLCLNCPGIICYLFRRTFPDLWKNHMEGSTGFPMLLAPYVHSGQCVIVRTEIRWVNGARIFLNHLQLDKHVEKYQGQDIHVLGLDEATQMTEYQIRYLFGSVRRGEWRPPTNAAPIVQRLIDLDRLPLILMSANPGGVSHKFIKERFIDQGSYTIVERKEVGERAFRRQFIPARAEDNPNLLKNDPDYLDRLESMGNPELVRAMREGDWEVVSGSMFGYVWRARRHVTERGFPIPATWDVWRGGDDGFSAPAAVHWITHNPDTGTFYVVAELYEKGLLPDEFVEKMRRIDQSIRRSIAEDVFDNDMELTGIMDSASFADTGTGKESRGRQMNRLGANWRPVEKAKGSRVMRVQMLHKVLAPNPRMPQDKFGVHLPGIRFFPSCLAAIETIPALQVSRNNPEDIDDDNDHSFDALTYGLTAKRNWFAKYKVKGI